MLACSKCQSQVYLRFNTVIMTATFTINTDGIVPQVVDINLDNSLDTKNVRFFCPVCKEVIPVSQLFMYCDECGEPFTVLKPTLKPLYCLLIN